MNTVKTSRKFSLLVAVFVLIAGIFIGGYIVLKSNRGAASQLDDILSGKSLTIGGCNPDQTDPDKDSDGDGLKDWQEMQVYRADPCKKDSDGDGYADGEEAASGYDPTKKAPEDALPNSKNPRPLPSNLTEALHQKLSEQITQNQIHAFTDQGQLLSSDQLQNFPAIQSAIQETVNSQAGLFAPNKIDEDQIKTSPDNSRAAIQKYASAASSAFKAGVTDKKTDADIFIAAIQNNDFSALNQQLESYQNAYQKLTELTVPSELTSIHKEQMEIISSVIKIYSAIKEVGDDPLKANIAIQAFQSTGQQFTDWSKKLVDFIKKHP